MPVVQNPTTETANTRPRHWHYQKEPLLKEQFGKTETDCSMSQGNVVSMNICRDGNNNRDWKGSGYPGLVLNAELKGLYCSDWNRFNYTWNVARDSMDLMGPLANRLRPGEALPSTTPSNLAKNIAYRERKLNIVTMKKAIQEHGVRKVTILENQVCMGYDSRGYSHTSR